MIKDFKLKYYKIKYWLNKRNHHSYINWDSFFMNLLWVVLLSIAFLIIQSNLNKLNEIVIFFIFLGSSLILIILFFWIKYFYKFLKKVYYWLKGERNWVRYLLMFILLILIWNVYQEKDTFFNPVLEIYNETNFSLFFPLKISWSFTNNLTESNSSSISSKLSDVGTFFTGPKIDDGWIHNFILIVNNERNNKGLSSMKESNNLNNIATKRFNKMMENPFISHYGAEEYNVGEVVFYPEGFSEQSYIEDLKLNAPLHWDLLMDPMFSQYGYYIEEGPILQIWDYCPITEIPGPNIDEKEFFEQRGCRTTVGNSIWLVIDMT